jgi:hypothetical protein
MKKAVSLLHLTIKKPLKTELSFSAKTRMRGAILQQHIAFPY